MSKLFTERIEKTPRIKVTPRPKEWPELSCDLKSLETIAITGAGSASVVYAGALKAMHEAKLLDSVKTFTGNSGGASIALLAALGYRGKELEQVVIAQNPHDLNPINLRWGRKLRSNLKREGVFDGQKILHSIQEICAKRIGEPNLTFSELSAYREKAIQNDRGFFNEKYDLAMKKKRSLLKRDKHFKFDFEKLSREASINEMIKIAKSFTELKCTGTELSRDKNGQRESKNIIFGTQNSPNLTIAKAVRVSCSFPFIFRNAELKDNKDKVHTYTDGAFSSLIPLPEATKDWKQPAGTLWMYSPYLYPDESSPPKKKQGFFTKKLLVLLAKYVGFNEIEANPQKAHNAYRTGKEIMDTMNEGFAKHTQDILSNEAMTSHLLPIHRNRRSGIDLNITDEQKHQLVNDAYYSTWAEIERLTDAKKIFSLNSDFQQGGHTR